MTDQRTDEDTDTEAEPQTIAWWLAERRTTPTGVVLTFHRATWWSDDSMTVQPGTVGAGTMHDPGEGTMVLVLSRSEAVPFEAAEVGRQYAFVTDLQPLYEGD